MKHIPFYLTAAFIVVKIKLTNSYLIILENENEKVSFYFACDNKQFSF